MKQQGPLGAHWRSIPVVNHNVEQTSPRLLAKTTSDEALVRIDRARHLLAEAKTIQDAKGLADVAASAETYLRRIKASEEAITEAQEIKARATCIMGGHAGPVAEAPRPSRRP
jgi:hypothetical protein